MIARFSTRQAVRGFMHDFLAALIALALIAIAAPAFAQTPPHSPSPDSILLAKQIIEIKGARKMMFDPLVRGVIEKVRDQFMQTNFMWANDLNEVTANMEREYESKASELEDASARIYASFFTEAELKQILTFYQSPLGRKMLVDEPKALDQSMAHAGEWSDTLAEEVIVKMRDEMKKRGHDL
jgi:uncharacterized protein